MTREEASEIVESAFDAWENEYSTGDDWSKEHEARDMAIKALEQKPCEDAISRQWLMECVNEGWIKFDTEKDKNRFIHLVRDIAPPVNPQPCGDLISRKAILEEFENDQYHLEFCKEHHIERSISMEMVRIRLHDLPSVNSQTKTGHWLALEEWKKDFKGFINELSMPKDDYNGIMEYIDELPVTPEPKTIQEKQAESEKYDKAFDDGYENGYAQARFDYEQESKTGHWIYKIYGGFHEQGDWYCSHCDYQFNYGNGHARHCPECGYEMSEPSEEISEYDKRRDQPY